ncbi:hypothetical protein SKB0092_40320 (plasmid) [Roseomonas mucosa]
MLVRIVPRPITRTPSLRDPIQATTRVTRGGEPAVDCIAKGKARVCYEFGSKVSVATTIEGGFVVGMRSMPGNPYDGHTLADALEQVETLTGHRPASPWSTAATATMACRARGSRRKTHLRHCVKQPHQPDIVCEAHDCTVSTLAVPAINASHYDPAVSHAESDIILDQHGAVAAVVGKGVA